VKQNSADEIAKMTSRDIYI